LLGEGGPGLEVVADVRAGVLDGVFVEVASDFGFAGAGFTRAVAVDDEGEIAGGEIGGTGSALGSGALATIGDRTSGRGSLVGSCAGVSDVRAGAGVLCVAFLTGVTTLLVDSLALEEIVGLDGVSVAFRGGHSRFSFSSAFAESPVDWLFTLGARWKLGMGVPGPMEVRFVCCSKRPMRFATLCRGRSSGNGLR